MGTRFTSRRRGALPALAVAALMACHTPDIPAPPAAARPLTGSGTFEPRLDLVVADLRRRLRDAGFTDLSVRSYSVPPDTSWDRVKAHYAQVLDGAWKPAAEIPASGFAYQLSTWRAGERHALAVALIETPDPAAPTPFRILVQATSIR